MEDFFLCIAVLFSIILELLLWKTGGDYNSVLSWENARKPENIPQKKGLFSSRQRVNLIGHRKDLKT